MFRVRRFRGFALGFGVSRFRVSRSGFDAFGFLRLWFSVRDSRFSRYGVPGSGFGVRGFALGVQSFHSSVFPGSGFQVRVFRVSRFGVFAVSRWVFGVSCSG